MAGIKPSIINPYDKDLSDHIEDITPASPSAQPEDRTVPLSVRFSNNPQVRESKTLQDWLSWLDDKDDSNEYADVVPRVLLALEHLPGEHNPIVLPLFASDVFGDPHALDANTRTGSAFNEALAFIAGRNPATANLSRSWRHLHRRYGISSLGSTMRILMWGFRPPTESGFSALMDASRTLSTPVSVTTASMAECGRIVRNGEKVFVVENPSVVESAARELGDACPPMVCTEGYPTAHLEDIISLLLSQGARVYCHTDFDTPGIGILERLVQLGATPWLMSPEDYLAVADHSSVFLGGRASLRSNRNIAIQDLCNTMYVVGKAAYEEQMLENYIIPFLRSVHVSQ